MFLIFVLQFRTWFFDSYLQLPWYWFTSFWLMMLLCWGLSECCSSKFPGPLTKSKAKKSFRQKRLDDDGNWNATDSRLVRFKSIWVKVKETALHFVSKYNQPGDSTHLPIHMCFGHDDTDPAPKVQPSEYLRWIVGLLNWHRRVLLGLAILGAFRLNVAYGYCSRPISGIRSTAIRSNKVQKRQGPIWIKTIRS
jgi:hypothetical protein